MHLPHDVLGWRQDIISALIMDCQAYYGEMNLDHKDDVFLHYQYLPSGQSWTDLVGSKKYHKHERILFKAFGIRMADIEYLRPILWENLLMRTIVNGSGDILDQFLWDRAKSSSLAVHGIESIQDQISILEKIDLAYQVRKISSILRNVGTFRKNLLKLIADYNKQDLRRLHKKASHSLGKYRGLLLYDRNRIMADKIDEIPYDIAFIALGVGHLWGNQGVIALLKRKKWKVNPISE